MRKRKTTRALSMRFSDGGAQPPAAQPVPPASPLDDSTPPAEKTFTLSEVDKMLAAERGEAVRAYQAQFERDKAEAERLAKMKVDERLAHAEKQAQEAAAELSAYRLKIEAQKMAAAAGLPVTHLDTVDFKAVGAEEVAALIEARARAYKADVEAALNERLRQKPPETHAGAGAAPCTLGGALAEHYKTK